MSVDVSVVIPNYNGMRHLEGCFSSLEAQKFRGFEVIVVDNGSTDGSVGYIKGSRLGTKLIELDRNYGFAAACNRGIEASCGRYIAILNNDTVVDTSWLSGLYGALENDKKAGMAASKILLNMETREIDSVGMLIYPDGIARQRGRCEIDTGQYDDKRETLFPSGCAAMYKREMLDEIGLFDEDFFAYCEDADLGLRGRLAGWGAVFVPDAVVWHKYSGTMGQYSDFKVFHVERNRVWVAVKNFPVSWLLAAPFYTILRYLFQFYSIVKGRGSSAKFVSEGSFLSGMAAVLRAHILAVAALSSMLRKRRSGLIKISQMEFKRILNGHRVSASELALKD
ncbi:MAG: glycosyltransferase family 2 protein [Nitrospirae bacterium]|nr:MAG: glycosyltransferase family 2 protein [Nitrospirota bacterium]